MKWEGYRKSKNFEDRRAMGTGGKVAVGGGLIGLIFLLIQVFLGGDPAQLTQALQDQMSPAPTAQGKELSAEDKRMGDFVSSVFAMTEDVWRGLFKQNGSVYREPKMVLFSDGVRSACGGASSSSGPFYCPADETVYMDLAFFNILRDRFGAKGGDFAIAYVIAHEVGHHVQHLQGILQKVQKMRKQMPQAEGNKVHVAMELQADYYAGVWAHYVRELLEPGDFEQALNAAAVVGNDNMQKQTQGYVVPESFTHGTSQQRMEWLTRGFKSGNLKDGDTYSVLLN